MVSNRFERAHNYRPYAVPLLVLLMTVLAQAQASTSEQALLRVWERFDRLKPPSIVPAMHLHVSEQPALNAWADPKTGDITITRMMVEIIGPNEGELAFVVAHEIGHIIGYWTGQSAKAQEAATTADQRDFLKSLGLLFSSNEYLRNRYLQVEEQLADANGLYLIHMAGYNPFDAAGFFGRMQMYFGTSSPWQRIWSPYLADHPFNEDRIENLRRVMAQLPRRQFMPSSNPAPTYLWLGRFKIDFVGPSGKHQSKEFVDVLGIYSEEDFRIAQPFELNARKQVIRSLVKASMSDQIKTIVDIQLLGVERTVAP